MFSICHSEHLHYLIICCCFFHIFWKYSEKFKISLFWYQGANSQLFCLQQHLWIKTWKRSPCPLIAYVQSCHFSWGWGWGGDYPLRISASPLHLSPHLNYAYERISQWPVTDIGGWPLVNESCSEIRNRIAFKIWTAVPCVEKYKTGRF